MDKLTQPRQGEYELNGVPVIPCLVFGPIMYSYDFVDDAHMEMPIEHLVERVMSETGFDLQSRADSYHCGGIGVEHNGKKTRHEIVCFYKTVPKNMN
jgi:hypothetical protein